MSGQEIFVIIIVALLLFGAEKLPDIAKTVGKGCAILKRQQMRSGGRLKQAQLISGRI